MLKYRLVSFPLLLLLLGVIIYSSNVGPYLFCLVAAIAIGIMLFETGCMLKKIEMESFPVGTGIFGGLFIFFFSLVNIGILLKSFLIVRYSQVLILLFFGLVLFFIMGGWIFLLICKKKKEFLQKFLNSLGILLFIGFPFLWMVYSYFGKVLPSVGPIPYHTGARQLLFLVLVTKAMDTGGYIFGMLSGRWMKNGNHKILPSVSPKKSWEGTFGGLLFSLTVSLIFYYIYAQAPYCRMQFQMLGVSLSWYLIAGVVLGIGSLAGDLTESALKRLCGVKDSGAIIPGMGGVFDVLDSFIYNGLLFWILGSIRW